MPKQDFYKFLFCISILIFIEAQTLTNFNVKIPSFNTTIGVITLVVVFYQVLLNIRQLNIMKRQDEILGRQAELRMGVSFNKTKSQFEFEIGNYGNKVTTDFYWDIFVSSELNNNIRVEPENKTILPLEEITHKEITYRRYNDMRTDKLYPLRSKFICNFPLPTKDTVGTFTFMWQIISEDGVFPSSKEFGFLNITVP